MQQRLALRDADPDERVAAVMAGHGRTLLRVAHHWSLCHDDALDAYQRGLEIFLKRAHAVDPATEVAWLKVVIKHEALAIRRSRQDSVNGDEADLDAHVPAAQRSVEEQIASGERVSRSAEALRALKPDEARALMLKAEGLSYQEIGERCGWTYTKVNRAITEGRRRFMKVYAAIEAGDECDRLAPVLAALADGTASSAQVVEIRPHLRHCMACRATVRELHMSRLRRVQLLLPLFALAPVRRLQELGGSFGAEDVRTPEQILRESPRIEIPAADVPTPAAGTPHVTDLGGQLTIPLDLPAKIGERIEHARRLRPGRLKDEIFALLSRSNGSDVAAGLHIATAGGGGRIASIATIVGFCISGAGAGALCVATGVVEAPRLILNNQQREKPRTQDEAKKRRVRAASRSSPAPASIAQQRSSLLQWTPAPSRDDSTRRSARVNTDQTRRRVLARSRTEASQQPEFGFEAGPAAASAATTEPASSSQTMRTNQTNDPAQKEFGP